MIDFTQAAALAKSKGAQLEFHGPIGTEAIESVEVALGGRFSPSYRKFLSDLGYGGIVYGPALLGIDPADPLDDSGGTVYGATLLLREDIGLPKRYVVIHFDPDLTVIWCLDLDTCDEAGECAVISFDIDAPQSPVALASSFAQLFLDYLRDRTPV